MDTRGYKNTYGNSVVTKILDILTNLAVHVELETKTNKYVLLYV